MKYVDIKITYQCNNHCAFCVQGNKRDYLTHKSVKEIEKSLKESFKKEYRGVVLTGGEPTLHPEFLDIVSLCKKIGYEIIQVQTNGRRFAYLDFCIKTIQAGATQFAPSLHGHTGKIHDFLTGTEGSFEQTILGIENLRKLNQQILVNSVVTAKNYKYLPELARLFVRLDVDHFKFSFVHILGAAHENRNWLVPEKKKVMPHLKKGLQIGIMAGKDVFTEAIPFCFLEGYEKNVGESKMPEIEIYDEGSAIDYDFYRKNKGKCKSSACRGCFYFEVCEGPWKEYVEIFGWKEFKPIKKKNVNNQ